MNAEPAAPAKKLIGGLALVYALAMVWIASSVLFSLNMKPVIMYWTVLALALGVVLSALPFQHPKASALAIGAALPLIIAAIVWLLAQFLAYRDPGSTLKGSELLWALKMIAMAIALCGAMTVAGTVCGRMLSARLLLPARATLVAGLAVSAVTLGLAALRFPEL